MLEAQALLLCESIRKFGGRFSSSLITVVSPRSQRRPSVAGIAKLSELGAVYYPLELVSPTPQYGPSYRVLGLAERARRRGPPILVQLDSDTIFLDEPDFACGEHELLARPVDVAGMCSTGPTDSREPLWQTMCEANRVKIEDLGFVIPSVTGAPVRSSYNAGLIVAPRHVFRVIEECFLNIVRAGVRPYAGHLSSLRSGAEVVGAAGAEMWGTSQAAIAIASAKELKSVRLLDLGYNVPLHLIDELNPLPKSIMHLHYHWLFEEGERNPLFDGRVSLPPDKADWLKERLPLGTADRGFGRSGTMRRIMARLKSWL